MPILVISSPWEEILAPGSLLDIIGNYVYLSREVDKSWDPYRKEAMSKFKQCERLSPIAYRIVDEFWRDYVKKVI